MAWQIYACAHCRKAFRFIAGPRPCKALCPSCGGLVGIPAANAPVAVVIPRKRRLPTFAAVALGLIAVLVAVMVLTWRMSGPGARGAGLATAAARAEPGCEKSPPPKGCRTEPRRAGSVSDGHLKAPVAYASGSSAFGVLPGTSKEPAPAMPSAEPATLYPADGQTDVPPVFSGGSEIPSSQAGQAGSPAAEGVALRALEKVNAYRAQAGLQAVALDPQLTAGCQAHCAYLARNAERPSTVGLGGHSEDPALPGYSADGSLAAESSVIAWGDVEPLAAIDDWMATLYHRVPLLDPHLKRIGFGHARRGGGWVTVLDVLRGKEPGPAAAAVLYPAPNQTGVPHTFRANEVPDPIPQATDRRAGFPITATFPAGATLTQMAFTLKDGAGQAVPVWSSSPEKPANPQFAAHQGTTVCLIAKKPLQPGMTYTVRGTGQVDGKPWSREWSFTTGPGADSAGVAAPRAPPHSK